MIKKNQHYINILQYILDTGVVLISFLIAYWVRFHIKPLPTTLDFLPLQEYYRIMPYILICYIGSNLFYGLYKPQRNQRFYNEFVQIVKAHILAMIGILSILFIQKEIDYSRWLLVVYSIVYIFVMTLERWSIRQTLRWLRRKGFNLKHILIVGANEIGFEFAKKIKSNPQLGYNLIGFIDAYRKGRVLKDSRVIYKVKDFEKALIENTIDEVIIALELKDYDSVAEIIYYCEKHGVKAQIIPAYKEFLPAKPSIDSLDEIPLINIRHVPLEEPLNALMKRSFDVLFSLTVIGILSPLLLVLAIGVKLSSPGPIIFKQERIGINRKPFMMYKFRSMKLQSRHEEKSKWTVKDDPRKTKFGAFIRKTSLDELPQFFNVLFGQMSVIGPRPERPYFVDKFKEEIPKYMIKHHVRPGITGWAQVNGWRGDTSIRKRIEHDIYYIENWTLGLDVKIIFKTILNGFISDQAY